MSEASCVYPTGQQLLLPPPWHPRRQTCQPRSCDTRLVRGPGRSTAAHEQGRPDGGMADPTTCFRQRDDAAVLFWKEGGRGMRARGWFSFLLLLSRRPRPAQLAKPCRSGVGCIRHDTIIAAQKYKEYAGGASEQLLSHHKHILSFPLLQSYSNKTTWCRTPFIL